MLKTQRREIALALKLQHPNIVQLLASFDQSSTHTVDTDMSLLQP
jgi:hypothetical protein